MSETTLYYFLIL